jgi:uncharacterized protein (DUF2336 family)
MALLFASRLTRTVRGYLRARRTRAIVLARLRAERAALERDAVQRVADWHARSAARAAAMRAHTVTRAVRVQRLTH